MRVTLRFLCLFPAFALPWLMACGENSDGAEQPSTEAEADAARPTPDLTVADVEEQRDACSARKRPAECLFVSIEAAVDASCDPPPPERPNRKRCLTEVYQEIGDVGWLTCLSSAYFDWAACLAAARCAHDATSACREQANPKLESCDPPALSDELTSRLAACGELDD